MSCVIQILYLKKTKQRLKYFGDIHRNEKSEAESQEFEQSIRPSFLLRLTLLASKPVLTTYKISIEVSSSYSKHKGKKPLGQVHIFALSAALKMRFKCCLLHYSIIEWHCKKNVLLIIFATYL